VAETKATRKLNKKPSLVGLGFFIPHPDEAVPRPKDLQALMYPELTADQTQHREADGA
jgi:hypothetical protein